MAKRTTFRDFGGVTAKQQEDWHGATPPDQEYKGFIRPEGQDAVPVYVPRRLGAVPGAEDQDIFKNVDALPPGPPPATAASSAPPAPPAGAGDGGLPPLGEPPTSTARSVIYGARAGLPGADSGRLGSRQRSWERYQLGSGRLERETAGMFPDREAGWMNRRSGFMGEGRLPPGVWDAAAAEANRRSAATALVNQRKQIDILLDRQKLQQNAGRYAMDLQKHEIEQGLVPFTLEEKRQGLVKGAQEIAENAKPFVPSVVDLGGGTSAITTSRKSAVPLVKPEKTPDGAGPTLSPDGKFYFSGGKWTPVPNKTGPQLTPKQRVEFQADRDRYGALLTEAEASGDTASAEGYRARLAHLDEALGTAPAAAAPGAAGAPATPSAPTPAQQEIRAQQVKALQDEIAYRRAEIAKGNQKPGPDWMPISRTHLEKIAAAEQQLRSLGGQPLDKTTAAAFMRQAGGDRAQAEQLAKAAGYTF